jgi:recombination protein RecA
LRSRRICLGVKVHLFHTSRELIMARDKEEKENKHKDFETAKKQLKGFIRPASEVDTPQFITTGHFTLDLAIGHGVSPEDTDFDVSELDLQNIGGYAKGKVVEISGNEGSGKSSLAYRTVGYAQKMGLKTLWIDTEQSFSHDLAAINGVDTDELQVANLMDLEDPDHIISAEEVFDRITDACMAGYKVIVLDSVANLTTQAELDNYLTEGGVGMGHLAQLMSKAMKRVVQYAAKYGVLIIMINQLREKIGVMFGNPETTPGGRALKFLASLRIKVNKQQSKDGQIRIEDENGKDRLVGNYSYIYVLKNRFGKPVEGQIKVPIYYEPYFPTVDETVFDAGRALKLIKPRLGVFSWGEFKVTGRTEFISEIKKQELLPKLVEEIKALATEQKYILPPEVLSFKPPVKEAEKTEDDADGSTKKAKRRGARKGAPDGAEEPVVS